MSSRATFLSLSDNILLNIAGNLPPPDLLGAMLAVPHLKELVETYENSVVKDILRAHPHLLPVIDQDGPLRTTGFTIVNDLLEPLHPSDSGREATAVHRLLKSLPNAAKYDDAELLNGVTGLTKYCKAYRELRAAASCNTKPFSAAAILDDLKRILKTRFEPATLTAMRAVYNLLSQRIYDADEDFVRPVGASVPHDYVGTNEDGDIGSCEFQRNLIGTVISSMDFYSSDFNQWEKFGLPLEVYESVIDEQDNTRFFEDAFDAVFDNIVPPKA